MSVNKKLVMTYQCSDDYTYSLAQTEPFEYESPEAALVDFEIALKESIRNEKNYGFFNFAGLHLENFNFRGQKNSLNLPTIQTLEEWFESNKPRPPFREETNSELTDS